MNSTQCQECSTNQYKARCEWLSNELAKARRSLATATDQLATARAQNSQLVETVRWLEGGGR